MDNKARRGADCQANTVDDRVGGAERFNGKGREFNLAAWLDLDHFNPLVEFMFFQLAQQQPQGQAGAVDSGGAEALPQKGQSADVVFVAMGQDQADNISTPLFKGTDVGQYQVDAEHVGFGKHQSAIDQQDFALRFDAEQVHTNFTKTAKGEQADLFIMFSRIVHGFPDSGRSGREPDR